MILFIKPTLEVNLQVVSDQTKSMSRFLYLQKPSPSHSIVCPSQFKMTVSSLWSASSPKIQDQYLTW